jgi:hypothetical protein
MSRTWLRLSATYYAFSMVVKPGRSSVNISFALAIANSTKSEEIVWFNGETPSN